jgi:hypothetical protein
MLEILSQLQVDDAVLILCQQTASYKQLQGVGQLETMDGCKRNLTRVANRNSRSRRELLRHVDRDQRARIDVRCHRSPRSSRMISAAPGLIRRLPNTARVRASRSGQGETAVAGLTGASRATGRRRRVTSTVSPRSTRAITRFRFCWSSRTDTVDRAMFDILSCIGRFGNIRR